MIDFTTVVAVDREHVEEWRWTWPSWRANRPELLAAPLLVICDGDVADDEWDRALAFLDHPRVRRVAWRTPEVDQREKMLTGLTLLPGRFVETPWLLKLDVDVVASEPAAWLREEWFQPDEAGRLPAFVASPWGYTKPAELIPRLEDWADAHPALKTFPRLGLRPEPGARVLGHPRITSWCFFGRTEWIREAASYAGDRLPVPSQDTYLWYVAARRGDFFRRVRMGPFGWKHCGRRRTLRQTVDGWRDSSLAHADPATSPRAPDREGPRAAPADRVTGDARRIPARPATTVARPAEGDEGVLFLLTGDGHAVRLAVALWSLREHYRGPATIVATRPESQAIAARLAADPRLAVRCRAVSPDFQGRNASYLQKIATMERDAPYERTLFLDADVAVAGDLRPLLEAARGSPLVATRFGDWSSRRGRVRKRIDRWRSIGPAEFAGVSWDELLDRAVQQHPAINTGVLAFRRGDDWLRRWRELALIGRRTFICDEIALQILLPWLDARVLDCRFNASPVHARGVEDARVWHFHGDRHVSDGAVALWEPSFRRAWEANAGGVREWAPAGDAAFGRWLESGATAPVAT